MVRRHCTLAVSLVLALSACSDGGGDSPAENKEATGTGAAADGKIGTVAPDTLASDLNEAEWKAACTDIETAGNDRKLVHGMCIIGGIVASVIGLDCQDTYELCLSEPADEKCDELPMNCEATLRELDTCWQAGLEALEPMTRELDCMSSLEALQGIYVDQPPECAVVKQKCPSLIPDFGMGFMSE